MKKRRQAAGTANPSIQSSSTPSSSAQDEVDSLLRTAGEPRAGAQCQTCRLPEAEREQYEQLALGFNLRRSEGTKRSWLWFTENCLRPKGYEYRFHSMQRHLRNCLGKEVY